MANLTVFVSGTSGFAGGNPTSGHHGRILGSSDHNVTFGETGLLVGDVIQSGRHQWDKGANVVSANDITLGGDGNFFIITTGVNTINRIATANWQAGSYVMLQFDVAITVTHGVDTGGGFQIINLSSDNDYLAEAGEVLSLVFNGVEWKEVSRTSTVGGSFHLVADVTVQVAGGGGVLSVFTVPNYVTGSVIAMRNGLMEDPDNVTENNPTNTTVTLSVAPADTEELFILYVPVTGVPGAALGGVGAANKVAYWSTPSNLTYDTELHYDPGSDFLGIQETSPASPLSVGGGISVGATLASVAAPTNGILVEGQVKIAGGSPGVDKVLRSDADGLATWVVPDSVASGNVEAVVIDFAYNSSYPLAIATVESGDVLVSSRIVVETVYDDGATVAELGIIADPDKYLTSLESDLTSLGEYLTDESDRYVGAETIRLTQTLGTPSAGAGYVIVLIMRA